MNRLKKYTQANPLIDLEYKDSVSEQPGERGYRPRMPKAAGTEPKPELVDLLIRMEQYIEHQNQHWLRNEFKKFK